MPTIKRALISVYDKTGVAEFATRLSALGVEIISTGGTAAALRAAGVPVTEAQELTGFPECLGGRVKTLHPKIHAGLLAVRSDGGHMAQLRELGIGTIDMLVSNLYPFKDTVGKPGATLGEAIENIDIGGPAMLRSAAKNFKFVTALTDPGDYGAVLDALSRGGAVPAAMNYALARKAFEHTAAYDALIAEYLRRNQYGGDAEDDSCNATIDSANAETGVCVVKDDSADVATDSGAVKSVSGDAKADSADAATGAGAGAAEISAPVLFPQQLTLTYEMAQQMRYGENPHQAAAFYAEPLPARGSLATFKQLHGKELSYNNIGDLDGALSLLQEFVAPAAVAVKHANPCGAAVADSIYEAFMKAYESDKMAIYGGIVALNRIVDLQTAEQIGGLYIEIVAAPGYDGDALKKLTRKKNIRILTVEMPGTARARGESNGNNGNGFGNGKNNDCDNYGNGGGIYREDAGSPGNPGGVAGGGPGNFGGRLFIKKVGGGLLAQTEDDTVLDMSALQFVTDKKPTEAQLADLRFAMTVVKHTKSNAIVLAKGGATIGVGPGQNSRIMAAKIAIETAGDRAVSSVAASDAYFPFDDCVAAFAAAGVKAIIHPGGSNNDQLSIDACNRLGIAMVLTGIRHFKH